MQSSSSLSGGLPVDAILDRIKQEFPDAEAEKNGPRKLHVGIQRERFLEFCEFIKRDLGFDHVSSVTGVDLVDKIQGVYHISSYGNDCIMEITVDLPRDDPKIESISSLWYGANYHEREAYDLLGIVYLNHPNLRRIMLPEDTEFHPLRKDFELEGA